MTITENIQGKGVLWYWKPNFDKWLVKLGMNGLFIVKNNNWVPIYGGIKVYFWIGSVGSNIYLRRHI